MTLRWRWSFALPIFALFHCAAPARDPGSAASVQEQAPTRSFHLLTGELVAERSVALGAPATESWNLQIRWLAADGDPVAAGDRVVELDAGALLGTVELSRSARLQAIDELERTRAEQVGALADSELARLEAAAALDGARLDASVQRDLLTARDHDERRLKLERAEAAVEIAGRKLDARQATATAEVGSRTIELSKAAAKLEAGESALRRLTVLAPAAGILVVGENPWESRKLQPGDNVWPGFAIVTIPDLSSLYVVADLSDVDELRVRAGMPAVAILDAFPDEPIAATIREVSTMAREIDRRGTRRAFRVVADLAAVNPEHHRPGMSVRLEVEQPLAAAAIPSTPVEPRR